MKSYTTDEPVYSDTIQIVETTDPAHADYINESVTQLLQNDLVLADLITGGSFNVIDVTIPTDAWVAFGDGNSDEPTESGGYNYYAYVGVEDVSTDQIPYVSLDAPSGKISFECGLCPTAETTDGSGLLFRAMSIPGDKMTGTCVLFSAVTT